MTYTDLTLTTLPERVVLAVDGHGSTESAAFGAAIEALYAALAALGGGDVPLEGTYEQGGGGEFDLERAEGWRWTLAVPAPDGARSLDGVRADPAVRLVRQPPTEIVQAEHHGPYAGEGESLAALRAEATARGRTIVGPHTERYLTDPRTTAPQDLRTLLWYPVRG